MAHYYRVMIFGQNVRLNKLSQMADYAFAAEIYSDPESQWPGHERVLFDWAQVPDDLTVAGGSIRYAVYLMYRDTVIRRFTNVEDLRYYGWQQLNPNAAAIVEIESRLVMYRARFREVSNSEGDFRDYRVRTFQFDPQRGCLSCMLPELLDGFRVVYVPRMGSRLCVAVEPGVPYACRFSHVCIEHLPKAERPGFQLIEVIVQHEHFDPVAKIAWLQAQIAAGNP